MRIVLVSGVIAWSHVLIAGHVYQNQFKLTNEVQIK